MKILHTLHWVQFAGTEKVCVDICNEMSKDNEVFLLTQKKIKPYINDSVNLVEFDFEQNRYNPLFLYKTAQILKQISPDVIHCHNTKELEIMYNARLFMSKKIPIIATKHTLKAKKRYEKADLCVAILEDTKEILKENSIIIKNGMYEKKTNPMLKLDTFHIVSAARLDPVKGMQTIIKAVSLLDFDFKFSIFGQGEQRAELEKQISDLGLENKVSIVGFVDNLQDYLASCDIQIIASVFEPYGLTAIDGIYYSPLLISTKTGICAQILPDELIFKNTAESLADKLTEIYNNYNHFVDVFAKVKTRKDEYSIEKMVQKYMDAYRGLIK
ncbi:glycosyltransferase [Campylobacter sp. RM9344]|uniref:Glycosyltransferase n=1 Tax=Campylobacter californiensis TaxID=1032243 RepID=A0AAW3ZT21_9BACT|nr:MULTISPECIES: glycosyltransferase [unclassified Campylobacter]MBE2984327.1 glycosyltransferase [Campylobacter sp. RM6883]MBE2994806.1 glycosyltransferase [Campylobacter sp. RM6913]MBE3029418.1 glycosyltransferase [Campylobacter sp. RM9344]MBE3607937.1 glycosyltransferase [Campylobacter sp. RM9337]QCD50740.1 glycosyltransferase, family 1 [Campylobacter sp. RM6914]